MECSESKDSLKSEESGQKPEAKKSIKFGDTNVNKNPSQGITSAPRAGIGAFPSASPSLPLVFTFGAVNPISSTLPTHGSLALNGLLQIAFRRRITPGFIRLLLALMFPVLHLLVKYLALVGGGGVRGGGYSL